MECSRSEIGGNGGKQPALMVPDAGLHSYWEQQRGDAFLSAALR